MAPLSEIFLGAPTSVMERGLQPPLSEAKQRKDLLLKQDQVVNTASSRLI